jgi:hypothetical protein
MGPSKTTEWGKPKLRLSMAFDWGLQLKNNRLKSQSIHGINKTRCKVNPILSDCQPFMQNDRPSDLLFAKALMRVSGRATPHFGGYGGGCQQTANDNIWCIRSGRNFITGKL